MDSKESEIDNIEALSSGKEDEDEIPLPQGDLNHHPP